MTSEEVIKTVGLEVPSVEMIPIDRIEHSVHQSQTRERAYDEDALKIYVTMIGAGSPTPPIIVHPNGRNTVIVDSGDHRVEASRRAGVTELAAFVLRETSDSQLASLRYLANRDHGPFWGLRERLEASVHMVRDLGYGVPAVVAMYGVSAGEINTRLRDLQNRDLLANVGLDPDQFSVEQRKTLVSLANDDAVLRETADLVVQAALPGKDTRALTQKVKRGKSEAERLAVVRKEKKALAPEIAASVSGAKKRLLFPKFRRAVTVINGIDVAELLTELNGDRTVMAEIQQAERTLTAVRRELRDRVAKSA